MTRGVARARIGWPGSPLSGPLCVEEDLRGSSCTEASLPPIPNRQSGGTSSDE